MMENIIREYVNKLNEEKIKELAYKNKISISDNESKILLMYAKNYWKEFCYGNPNDLIEELRTGLNKDTFNKLFDLYKKYKKKEMDF